MNAYHPLYIVYQSKYLDTLMGLYCGWNLSYKPGFKFSNVFSLIALFQLRKYHHELAPSTHDFILPLLCFII